MAAPAYTLPDGVDLLRGSTPRPTQAKFLESNARRKVYIGNLGSGKTQAIVWQDVILQHMYAPNFTLIGRYRYRDLADTTRKRYLDIVDPELIAERSIPERGDGYIQWKCGGRTIFRNLDEPDKFGSLDLGAAGIDELSECPRPVWDQVDSRIGRHWATMGIKDRTKWPYSPLYGGGNPGGRDYVWELFFKPPRPALVPGKPVEFEGFHPAPRENVEALPPGYYEEIAKGKPDWWVRRYIKGVLGAIEGLVWPSFDEDLHVVPSFPVPKHWRTISGHDHGQRNPTACLWVAMDEDENVVAYRDYEKVGLVPREHCRNILNLERPRLERPERRIADSSMFNLTIPTPNSSKWHTVADEYDLCGIVLERGDKNDDATRLRVAAMLWPDPTRRFPAWHPSAGQLGSPRLFFMDRCERTIEEVSSWRFKDARKDGSMPEEPVDKDDHLCDCLVYICASFPEATVTPKPLQKDPTRAEWQRERVKRISRKAYKEAEERATIEMNEIMGWGDGD